MRHRRGLMIAATLAAGCQFDTGGAAKLADSGPGQDTLGSRDAAVDGAQPEPCTETCTGWAYTPTNYTPCAGGEKLGAKWMLSDGLYVLSSADGTLTDPDGDVVDTCSSLDPQTEGPMLRTILVDGLELPAGSTLRVVGPHPVLIAVHGNADVDGVIDGSAIDLGGGLFDPGPGAGDAALCGLGQGGNGTASGTGGGGGAGGGGFGRLGGDGTQGGSGGARGDRGESFGDDSLAPLRGGCAGGSGGAGQGGGSGGQGGGAGGAIQIAAEGALAMNGTIRASGGGGQGGDGSAGGAGGGGSGGAIFLEASALTVTPSATLCANGGSGGTGADRAPGPDGAQATCDENTGATTSSSGDGGPGGRGGFRGGNNGGDGDSATGPDQSAGGGGGGGGVGIIRLRSAVQGLSFDDGVTVVTPQPRVD